MSKVSMTHLCLRQDRDPNGKRGLRFELLGALFEGGDLRTLK